AQVSVLGGDIKEYQVLIDPARMRHYGVSLDEVMAVTRNMNQNVNGGIIYEHSNEYIVRGMLSTTDVEQMGRAVIKTVDGVPVTLEDVADVKIGSQEPKLGLASERGKPAVLVTVSKQPQTGTIELTEKLIAALDDVQKNLPPDVKISTDIFRQSRFIDSSIDNVKTSLYEGAIFVIIVLFLFLANVRTTLISLVTLPLALVVAILTLHYLGLSINTMSLGGMAIAIGSLVDDAIVDVENVWKRLRENRLLPEGERRGIIEVVFDASKEVRMPILNSTLIIVVSFVPLFFLSGMEGRMLVPLGIAFIVALFASTFVALTLTPVLCSYLLGNNKGEGLPKEAFVAVWMKKHYERALLGALKYNKWVLGVTIALFVVALGCFFTLGRSFLPSFNEGSLTINITSMPGVSLEESDKLGRRAEELLLSIPEIQTVARKTGRAELDEHSRGVNGSEIEAPYELKDRSKDEMMQEVRDKLNTLSGANIELGQPISHRIDAMLSGTKASIAIKLFGDDLNHLYLYANRIKTAIADVEGVADLNVEQQIERPQLQIVPKREMMAKYGVTMPEFAEFVEVNLAGSVVSQVYEKGKVFNLIVRAKDNARDEMNKVRDLMIDTPSGERIPISYVADVVSTMGPNTVSRENVKRKIVISANTSGRDLRGVVNDVQERIEANVKLPEGYHVEYGGQFESEQAASQTLLLTSLMSIVVIFLLLYMQFKNAAQSGVILINLPLALIGGVFALMITTGEVSIPAIIGFISLFGIATRNGMLLISHYNDLREGGMPLKESIVKGSLDRLNPILMTALTSALALIPLAFRGDLPGNEIQSPMAQVILGGLLTSTLLNGFIVPIVYELMNKKK
ncbi:MAG: efflux RND transporter permease subunit, partial [Bacteroidaceae bacterium]|nr:efflux RND transporter permease subunit [Bacteroidaceae bacterium]